MKGYSLVVLAMALTMLMINVPSASAHDDGLFVVLTTDRTSYSQGQEIKATVHVFHNGRMVDADTPPVMVFALLNEDDHWTEGEIEVNATTVREAEGIYSANFELLLSYFEEGSYVHVSLRPEYENDEGDGILLTYGRSDEEDTTYDLVSENELWGTSVDLVPGDPGQMGLEVSYIVHNVEDLPLGPGQTAEFTVFVKEDGVPVGPEEFDMYTEGDELVAFTNPSLGTYKGVVTADGQAGENQEIELYVEASKGSSTAELTLTFEVLVMQIWLHRLQSPTEGNVTFEVCVADGEGKAVQGANVGLWVPSDSEDFEHYRTTDSNGKSLFTVSTEEGELTIEGWAKKGDVNQSFYGSMLLEEEGSEEEEQLDDPDMVGFDVVIDDRGDPPEGNQLDIDFYAYMDGSPLHGSRVFYYIYTQTAVLKKGDVTTGTGGKFPLSFKRPQGRLPVEFAFKVENGYHPNASAGYDWNDGDGDGFSDDFEISLGTDPEDWADYPCTYRDSDMDGYGDEFEDSIGTDPMESASVPSTYNDTDSDGWGDEFELENGTDPLDEMDIPEDFLDSDGDFHDDEEEVFYGTDPEDIEDMPFNAHSVNSDLDGIWSHGWTWDEQYDLEEVFYGTDPNDEHWYPYDLYSNDTDMDDVSDEEEVFYGTDPEDFFDSPKGGYDPWDPYSSDHNSSDGWRYELDEEYYWDFLFDMFFDLHNDSVLIEIGELVLGGRNEVGMTSDLDWGEAYCGLLVGEVKGLEELMGNGLEQEWVQIEPDMGSPMYPTGDGWGAGLVLPEFLPGGEQTYTLICGVSSEESGTFNMVKVKEGGSAGTDTGEGDDDDRPFPVWAVCCIVTAIVAVVLIAVLLVIFTRRRKAGTDVVSEEQGAE